MKKSQGFTLIEILIALAISSFVMIMIFKAIELIQRSSVRYKALIANDSQQERLFAQLQKDISGMVIPLYGYIISSKDSPEEQKKKQSSYYEPYSLRIDIENDQLKKLSFVSTSILSQYNKNNKRLIRVTYLLVPHDSDSSLFSIVREEAGLDKKIISSYTVCDNIASCMVSCSIITENDGKKRVEDVSSWALADSMQKKKESSSESFEKKIEIPQILSLKGTCIDRVSKYEYPFNYSFFIPIDPRSHKKSNAVEPEKAPVKERPSAAKMPSVTPQGLGGNIPEKKMMPLNITGFKR